jgi:hypothetical protein
MMAFPRRYGGNLAPGPPFGSEGAGSHGTITTETSVRPIGSPGRRVYHRGRGSDSDRRRHFRAMDEGPPTHQGETRESAIPRECKRRVAFCSSLP